MKKHILLLFVSILGISCYAQRSMWHSICVYGDTVETYLCSSIDSISYSVDDEDAILQNIWNRNVNITERVASVDSILFYNPYAENIVEIDEGINLWDKAYVTPIGYFRYKSSMPFVEEEDKDDFEVLSYVSFDEKESAYMVFDKTTHLPLCLYMDSVAVHMDYLADSLCAFTIVDKNGVTADWEFEFSKAKIGNVTKYADNDLKRNIWYLTNIFNQVGNHNAENVTKQYLTNPSFEEGYNQWTINLNGTGEQNLEINTTHAVPDGTHYLGFWRSSLYNAEISQQITLPEGKYKISVDVEYSCNNDPGCCWSMAQLYFGDQRSELVAFDKSRSGNAIWQTFEHTITLHKETTANLGVILHPSSGGSWGHLDNFQIIKLIDAISSSEEQGNKTESGKYSHTMECSKWIDITSDYLVNGDLSSEYGWSKNGVVDHFAESNRFLAFYSGWGSLQYSNASLMQEVLLPAGKYRLDGKAYFRQGEGINDYPEISLGYMVAGDNKIKVATLASESIGVNVVDASSAADAFYNIGSYNCSLEFTLSEKTLINLGYECSFDMKRSWMGLGAMSLSKALFNDDVLASLEMFEHLLNLDVVDYRTLSFDLPKVNGNYIFSIPSTTDKDSFLSTYYSTYITTGKHSDVTLTTAKLSGSVRSVNHIYMQKGQYGIICDESLDSLSLGVADYILYDEKEIPSFEYITKCQGLKSSTKYYYKAFYLECDCSNIIYGDVHNFITLSPIVITGGCIEVTDRSATIECYYDGIPSDATCGVILSWDGGEKFLISDDSINALKSYNISKLMPSTTYSCRAFVETGDTIFYGSNRTFTTKKLDMTGRWAFKCGDSFYIVDFYADGTTSKYDGVNYFRWTVNGRELNLDVKNDFASSWNSPWIEYRGTFDEDFAFVSGNEYRCMFVGTNYVYREDILGEFTLNKYIASTGNCLEYDLNSATVQCYYENVPEGAECGIILSWDEGVDTIPSSSEEATKVFVLNDLTSFKTYTYCAYIKYGGKIYTGGNKTFMPKHPVIPDLSGTWVFEQSFYWVKTVNLQFVKSGDGWVEYEYSEGSSSLTCTVYADQKIKINVYISAGYDSRANFEGVANSTFTSFSGSSFDRSQEHPLGWDVSTVEYPWVFCRP